jgi:hypothetical protein
MIPLLKELYVSMAFQATSKWSIDYFLINELDLGDGT